MNSLEHAIRVSKQALQPLIENNSQLVPRDAETVSVRAIPVIASQGSDRFRRRSSPDQIHQKFRVQVPDGREILTRISFDNRRTSTRGRTTLPDRLTLALPTGESIIDMLYKFEPASEEDERAPRPMSLTVRVNDLPPLKHLFPVPKHGFREGFSRMGSEMMFAEQKDFGANDRLPVLHQFQPDFSLPTTKVQLIEGENK